MVSLIANIYHLNLNKRMNSPLISFRMEGALLRMRRQHDDLANRNARNGDSLDSPSSPPRFVSQTVLQLQNQLLKKDTEHTERIVEMVITFRQQPPAGCT